MPVDPNEPTYCLCQQVSYGEMIGCDNQEPVCFLLSLDTASLNGTWSCTIKLQNFEALYFQAYYSHEPQQNLWVDYIHCT